MLARVSSRPASTIAVATLLLAVGFLVSTGVGALSTVLVIGVLVLQTAAGALTWMWIRRGEADGLELLGIGLALGTVVSVLLGLISTAIGGSPWGWLLFPVVALALWWLRGRRRSSVTPIDLGTTVTAFGAVVLGTVSLLPNVVNYPLRWSGEWSRYHGDMLFFESLSSSLAQWGPLDSIFSPDVLIRYHWLTYAWAGQVTASSGVEPFVVLVRVLPFVSVVGSVLIAVAWARSLSTVVWVPLLAVVLLVLGGYVGGTYGTIFNFDSPSQSMTTMWLLAFAWIVFIILRDQSKQIGTHWPLLASVGFLSFGLAAGKVSAGVVAGGAVVWLFAIAWIRRTPWRRSATQVGIVSVASLVAGYLAVVAGSADPGGLNIGSLIDRASSIQGLNPLPGSTGIVLGTLILSIAITARWAGLVWFLSDSARRWSPETQISVGFALSGLVTVFLLSGGMNDTWFALAASAPIAVVSAVGVGESARVFNMRRRAALAWFLIVAAVVFVVVFALWATGASGGNVWTSTWRWSAPIVGVVGAIALGAMGGALFGRGPRARLAGAIVMVVLVAAPSRLVGVGTGQVGVQPGLGSDAFSPVTVFVETQDRALVGGWTDSQVEAAQWLRDQSGPRTLVATNVTLSPLVPALTGRQTWVSGIHYQAPYGTSGNLPTLLDRERVVWNAVRQPSQESMRPLCVAGVEWVWIDPLRSGDEIWRDLGDVAFERADVALVDMRNACG